MIKVGLTGGIGSGKSFVSQIFKKLGVPVFSADDIAKEIINNNLPIKKQLIEYFGKDIYLKNGAIHRKKLANIIFNNEIALHKINSLIHPAVRIEFNKWAEKQSSSYVIQEAAILFETNQHVFFDKIITVTAPIQIKIERIIKRDNSSQELVLQRMKNQMDDEIIIEKSDYVIYNNGNNLILPQIVSIHEKLK